MTDTELLAECKAGLGMPIDGTQFDGVLKPKLLAVKSYMAGAGVSAEMLANDLAVGAIVVGVTDLYNLSSGDISFSAVFHVLLTQLACRSLPEVT
ncbi:hypothetical protein ACDZ28_13610 [Paenibacillus sp. RS8]|uniref:hypothetical protein n=1 Tax=Paenibacillus sp. RS8 TaxID=3242681 RepID=UPI0035BED59D